MKAPLRLFAALDGMLVIARDVLFVARLTPSEVLARSALILEGGAPDEALGPDADIVPLRRVERLEGRLRGRDLAFTVGGTAISLRFPDRKSRDAALEAIAEAAGRPLEIGRGRSGWRGPAAGALALSALGIAAAAWKEDAAKALGIALLVLAYEVRPQRRIGWGKKDAL